MQRRLTAAFLLIAVAAVLLVGFGTLLLAQRGARQEVAGELTEQLKAISDLAAGNRSFRSFGPALARSQRAFDFESLQVAAITPDGDLLILTAPEPGRGRPAVPTTAEGPPGTPSSLDGRQRAAFDRGDVVIINDGRSVFGLSRLDLEFRESEVSGVRLALLARQNVTPLPRRTMSWFLLSSAVVVTGAAAAGGWLARRLARPVQMLQHTTAALAAGDLNARTEVHGDDELADLGRSVNMMAAELQRSKQLDQQFLMSISHDLRTPLTAIGGYGEALVDGTAADTTGVGRIIVGQARRLERLVQDLLDLARLDANQFTLARDPVDLAVVAGRAVAALTATAAADGIELQFSRQSPQPLMVIGDPDRLTQVVTNLIDNGTKFADTTVSVTTDREDSWVLVSVFDDGPGIADEDLPRVFDRLYTGQLQPRQAQTSTGLGLTIVKELVTAMYGTVAVARSPTGGTVFTVRLPSAS